MAHKIPETGTIVIQIPKWNPQASSPKSVLTAGAIGCTATSGFVKTNKVVCTFAENVNTGNTLDQLTVTGEFDSTATKIVFRVSNFRNPPSLSAFTGISIVTSASSTTRRIDQATNVSLTVTQAATLDASRVIMTIANTKINTQTAYTFNIRVSLPLPIGSSIKLTFPATVTPASTGLVVTGRTNLKSTITSTYDSTAKALTLTDISTAYIDEGFYIEFAINLVRNPPTTATSASIVYESFDPSGKGIEKASAGITVTATPGTITGASVVPTVTTIRTATTYTFRFRPENEVPVGAIIYIVFPDIISISDRTSTA